MQETSMEIIYSTYPSPLGPVFIAGIEGSVIRIRISGEEGDFLKSIESEYKAHFSRHRRRFSGLFKDLDRYFKGRPTEFSAPLFLKGSQFDKDVWQAIKAVPWGRVATYKAIAEASGHAKAFRAVGGACGRNPVPIIIPCHRVLNRDMTIGGYTGGVWIKKRLLEIEGCPQG
jgi:methylated-DNA-[protein]-cysteine S-methyltransferase